MQFAIIHCMSICIDIDLLESIVSVYVIQYMNDVDQCELYSQIEDMIKIDSSLMS